MSARPIIYWLTSSFLAVMAAHAAGPAGMEPASLNLAQAADSLILPVPEPSRALLLFAGIMAMAFTYRRVWLNWKRGA